MYSRVQEMVKDLVGKPCWRKQVGGDRSLSLGFGGRHRHKGVLTSRDYGEWEIGSYCASWRVVKAGLIICGSQDSVDSVDELNIAMARIDLGQFTALKRLGELDVRVECDNGFSIDFLATISDDDECFHIFCPQKHIIVFSIATGWKVGPSDKPWS